MHLTHRELITCVDKNESKYLFTYMIALSYQGYLSLNDVIFFNIFMLIVSLFR